MNKEELINLIKPYIDKNPEGVFDCGEFDLDVHLPDGRKTFSLFVDGDTFIHIPLSLNLENAILIQEVVRSLGREVRHTWAEQYSTNPRSK